MYRLPHFTETDLAVILEFMKKFSFATMIGAGEKPVATQIPVLISATEEGIMLKGHFMRGTDHYETLIKNPETLFLFIGPQCYVSASWYEERGHGSTWNYMSVQARGKLCFYNDVQTVELLQELTHYFEDTQTRPELLENMNEAYINTNVRAIIGFETRLENVQATFKLSQNKDDESYRKIVENLGKSENYNEIIIAAEMKKRRNYLF